MRSPVGRAYFSAALFVLALLPRLYVAIAWTREPVWDGHYYDIGARNIAAGLGYVGSSGGAWCHYPVGYSGLLGGAYLVAGDGRYVGPVLNALVGAVLAVLTYLLARYLMTERRARVAGVLTALYPGLILYSALLMTEPVAGLSLVAAALAAARHRGSDKGALIAGLLLGLGTLVRPQSILCAPAIGLFAMGSGGGLQGGQAGAAKRGLRAAAIASVVALMVVAPWALRNCKVMDGCAFVSTNAGWNLAIGSFPGATGRFAGLTGGDGCKIVTGQVQQDRCWMKLGAAWIASDPKRWLALAPHKLSYTFDHESFPIGYLAEADPGAWPERQRRIGRGVLSWTHRAVLALAGFGLLARPTLRRPSSLLPPLGLGLYVWYAAMTPSHPFWPLALAIPLLAFARWRERSRLAVALYAAVAVASVAIIHAVFFGEDRYHMVITPLLCVLAARALSPSAQQPTASSA